MSWWTHILLEALSREGRNFARIIKHYWHHWRVIIPKNLKTHALQFWPEKVAILTYLCKFLGSYMDTRALKSKTIKAMESLKPKDSRIEVKTKHDRRFIYPTSTRTILSKNNLYSRDNLLHSWWWHWSCIKMSRGSVFQVLNELLKIPTEVSTIINANQST